MRRQHNARSSIPLLVVGIGVLLALNWYLLQSPVDISPIDPEKSSANEQVTPSLKLATPLDSKPANRFPELVNRPLFHPSRRQIKREAVATDRVDSQPSELQLVGVMKLSGTGARALIRSAGARAGKWIAEGEQFNGWTLRTVGERSVMVEAGGRSHELTLGAPRSDEAPERGGRRR